MTVPRSLRPVPHDHAAGQDVLVAVGRMDRLLGEVMAGRAVRVSRAERAWDGRHRRAFDAADDDLRDAARLVGRLLDDLRARVHAEERAIAAENRERAWARRQWEARQRQQLDEVRR